MQSQFYQSLPQDPGVYLFFNSSGKVIYVGKAVNLKKRVRSYFANRKDLGEKTSILVSQIDKIKTIRVESEIESLLLEANLIKKYQPKYNIKLTDGKAYPLIRITIKDEYPTVLTARKPTDLNSLYFGPFPNSSAMRLVLKTVRRIFPFQSSVNHPNKICFYYHLGLCPCPKILKDKKYKRTIKHIIKFLNGKTKSVIRDLEKERNEFSKALQFEDALLLQNKIDAIKLVTGKFYKPFDYEKNPNLREDIRNEELSLLRESMNKEGVGVTKLNRIECYDISNTSGKNATGAMAVFIKGEKQPSLYRRFRIRRTYNDLPNDFAMMEEVITRRLKHNEWAIPDLIIVDGGKGQISSAIKALARENIKIPVIGLTKQEEIIITANFKEVKLPKDSRQLHLVMRIRDEAHRFAISYHKKLRAKSTYN